MPSPIRNDLHISHADPAARAAVSGAVSGAIKYGILSAIGGIGAYALSPLFRGLTLQFRVYLWMCPTTIGSMVEADYRLRQYENMIRAEQRRMVEKARDEAFVLEMKELEEMEERQRTRQQQQEEQQW